ncbi:MAG: hypothetical protein V4751_14730 [Pseudomonadota bacterium]
MSDIKMTAVADGNLAGALTVQYLEELSEPREKLEEKIRSRLIEFATELQKIKQLREVSQR